MIYDILRSLTISSCGYSLGLGLGFNLDCEPVTKSRLSFNG